jgi:hypothetical protein
MATTNIVDFTRRDEMTDALTELLKTGAQALIASEPPPVCRRLQSKYGWSLWKKVTEQTGFRPRSAPARFG